MIETEDLEQLSPCSSMLRLECVLQSRGNHGQCISLLHIEGILLVGAAEGPHIYHSQLNYLSSVITITPSHSNGEGADISNDNSEYDDDDDDANDDDDDIS